MAWRDPELGLKSRTYGHDERDKAKDLKDFLDANGNSLRLAQESKLRKDSEAPTVSEMVLNHITLLTKPQPGTVAKYRRITAAHIDTAELGGMPIDRVKAAHVQEWFAGMLAAPRHRGGEVKQLSAKSRKNVHGLLSAAFKRAVADEVLSRNPAAGISSPETIEAREPVYLSPADLDLLVERTEKHYRLFMKLLAKSGLRYSEATALRRSDIRVADGRCTIVVSRAWKDTGAGEVVGIPKSKRSRRNVPLGVKFSAELIPHLETLALSDLAFTKPRGSRIDNSSFHKDVWQPLVKVLVKEKLLARAPWIHEIRHAHATHLLERGIPIQDVQGRLGHEDPQTTLRVYARLTSSGALAAADALD